jgi:hypothetical protein
VHFNARSTRALHLTFEPSIGVTDFWELGGYLQTALDPDGTWRFDGVKLRSKFIIPAKSDARWKLGVNFELAYSSGEWDAEVRPIVAWENERWAFAFNPIVGISKDDPTFEPCGYALIKFAPVLSVGLEYYAGLGPMARFAPLSQQEHYVYEVVNLLALKWLELNLGLGQGLTAASDRLVFKTIIGVAWP